MKSTREKHIEREPIRVENIPTYSLILHLKNFCSFMSANAIPAFLASDRLTRQKLLEAHGNIAVTVVIISLECIRHAPQTDTRLHEQVEAHARRRRTLGMPVHQPSLRLERCEQHRDERLAQAISKCRESILELLQTDATAAVDVEPVKKLAPSG